MPGNERSLMNTITVDDSRCYRFSLKCNVV